MGRSQPLKHSTSTSPMAVTAVVTAPRDPFSHHERRVGDGSGMDRGQRAPGRGGASRTRAGLLGADRKRTKITGAKRAPKKYSATRSRNRDREGAGPRRKPVGERLPCGRHDIDGRRFRTRMGERRTRACHRRRRRKAVRLEQSRFQDPGDSFRADRASEIRLRQNGSCGSKACEKLTF